MVSLFLLWKVMWWCRRNKLMLLLWLWLYVLVWLDEFVVELVAVEHRVSFGVQQEW